MPMTIAELRIRADSERLDAERRMNDADTACKRLLAAHQADGTDMLPPEQATRAETLIQAKRAARDDIRRAEITLDNVRSLEHEAVADRAAWADVRPTRAAGILHGDAELRVGTPGLPPSAGQDGPRWMRRDDGRPGAVERGQRYADHPVVEQEITRAAGRDEHVIGMHGGIGHMIRSMSTSSGSAIVPTIWAADVIDRARNMAAVMQAGAQVIPMDAKVVQLGRLTADPASTFRTEGSTITASDPTFDNVTLTATTLSALVIGSLEWFQDVTPGGGADQLVSEALAKVLALQIDLVALYGQIVAGAETTAVGNNLLPNGVGLPSPNPRGILANLLANASTSVLGSATNGTVQTPATFWKEILDTIWTVRDFNESPNALIWPSKLARIYAEAVNTLNDPMRVPPDLDTGGPVTKYISNQIPSGFTQGTGTLMSDVIVGDFRQLLIGQRLDLQITTLTERYAELGQIGILATWRGDVQLARPRAFAAYRYIKGT